MNYIELKCFINPYSELTAEILMAELCELEFESFDNTGDGLKAYIQEQKLDKTKIEQLAINNNTELGSISYKYKLIKSQNWNAIWEQNFKPVIINDQCIIKAPFHKNTPTIEYEVIIQPQMSFGTGHHETTSLMIEKLLGIDCKGKSVLDMGCGTGVLAILSSLRGAEKITAIDIDEWAYTNTLENIKTNKCSNITVLHGGVELLGNKEFDIILANINLNILLQDIPFYANVLKCHGLLVMSGLYQSDIKVLTEVALKNNLKFKEYKEDNKWVAVEFSKI